MPEAVSEALRHACPCPHASLGGSLVRGVATAVVTVESRQAVYL